MPAQVGGGWETVHQADGLEYFDNAGFAVAGLDDLDGDGVNDFAIGAPAADPNGTTGAGSVFLISGATGSLIRRIDGGLPGDALGYSVANPGDVNGDGIGDVLIGIRFADPGGILDAGRGGLYSGATGNPLFFFGGQGLGDNMGYSIASLGDLDQDGVADLAVGAPYTDPGGLANAGSVGVFSGATGTLIRRHDGENPGDQFGLSVAGAGDLDLDGIPDVLIGAPLTDPGNFVNAGSAYVYSGFDGSLIVRQDGEFPNDRLGTSVAGVGDLDADGFDEIAVGAPLVDPGGISSGGTAYVFHLGGQAELFRFEGQFLDEMGHAVAAAGDVDGDGVPDILVGVGFANPGERINAGSAFVYAGASGILLGRVDGGAEDDQLGHGISALADLDGDGRAEFLVGAPFADPGGRFSAGITQVVGFNPFITADGISISDASGGMIRYVLEFPAAAAGKPYRILASAAGTGPTDVNGLQVPLSLDSFLSRTLTGGYPPYTSGFAGNLGPLSRALAVFAPAPGRLPNTLVGKLFHFSAVVGLSVNSTVRYVSVPVPLQILP